MYYSIHFPADFKNIPPIRDMVFHAARLQEFPEEEANHLKSVTDELITNAIEYGSDAKSEVSFEIFADEKMIKLICADQGHGNTMTALELGKKIREPVLLNAMRGRGLRQIVKSFVSDLEFHDRPGGGIIATAILKKD